MDLTISVISCIWFKTIPEAFKIIVLPTTTTVCGKINRLPPGNQLEITVIRTHKKSRIGSPQSTFESTAALNYSSRPKLQLGSVHVKIDV